MASMEDGELRRRKVLPHPLQTGADEGMELRRRISSNISRDLPSPMGTSSPVQAGKGCVSLNEGFLQDSGYHDHDHLSDSEDKECTVQDQVMSGIDTRGSERSCLKIVGPSLVLLVILGAIGYGLLIPSKLERELNGKYKSIQFGAGVEHFEDEADFTDQNLDYPDGPNFRSSFDYYDDPNFRSNFDYPDNPNFRRASKAFTNEDENDDNPDEPSLRTVSESD